MASLYAQQTSACPLIDLNALCYVCAAAWPLFLTLPPVLQTCLTMSDAAVLRVYRVYASLQALYSYATSSSAANTHADRPTAAASLAMLPELHVEGFDAEQVWLQLDMASAQLVRRAKRLLKKAGPEPSLLTPETEEDLSGQHASHCTTVFLSDIISSIHLGLGFFVGLTVSTMARSAIAVHPPGGEPSRTTASWGPSEMADDTPSSTGQLACTQYLLSSASCAAMSEAISLYSERNCYQWSQTQKLHVRLSAQNYIPTLYLQFAR